jgi:hypothetical protein
MAQKATTPAHERQIAALWDVQPQLSVRKIGTMVDPPLGKSAVAGIAFRLGLTRRPSPIIRRGADPPPVAVIKPPQVAKPVKVLIPKAPVLIPKPQVTVTKPKPNAGRTPKPPQQKVSPRVPSLPKIAAVTTVPPPAPRGSGPLVWGFHCKACSRRLFGADQCAARLIAEAA